MLILASLETTHYTYEPSGPLSRILVSVAWSDYEYFYSPLDEVPVHRRVTPSFEFTGNNLYHTWVESGYLPKPSIFWSVFLNYRKDCFNMKCFLFCFTVLRCQILFPPANGLLVGDCDNSYGSTCRITCDDGYNLLGSESLTCLKKAGHLIGEWNESVPTCKSKWQLVPAFMSPFWHQEWGIRALGNLRFTRDDARGGHCHHQDFRFTRCH